MTLYGYELFNRYWRKFELYKIDNDGKTIKNNPYSYFYRMIERSYFSILKNYKRNNYENYYMFTNEDLDIVNKNNEDFDFVNDNEDFKIDNYEFQDVIYDINIINYNFLKKMKNLNQEYLHKGIHSFFFHKEAVKFVKNDKSFNEILQLLTKN